MAHRMSLPGLKFFPPRINPAQRYPHRRFSQTPLSAYPRKGFEDRNSINAEATEYSKSGTDNQAAEEQGAFDPKVTRPEEQRELSGKGEQNDPLEVSPGNPEVSKQRGETEGGAENAPRNEKSGGFGSPKKNGEVFKR